MTKKEKKYIDNKVNLIRAVIHGTLAGTYMFGPPVGKTMGEAIRWQTDRAMQMIEKDVTNVFYYGKKCGKIQ